MQSLEIHQSAGPDWDEKPARLHNQWVRKQWAAPHHEFSSFSVRTSHLKLDFWDYPLETDCSCPYTMQKWACYYHSGMWVHSWSITVLTWDWPRLEIKCIHIEEMSDELNVPPLLSRATSRMWSARPQMTVCCCSNNMAKTPVAQTNKWLNAIWTKLSDTWKHIWIGKSLGNIHSFI